MTQPAQTILLTGLPSGFLAQKLLAQLLVRHPEAHIQCLVAEALIDRVEPILQRLPAPDQKRVAVLQGDVTAMDFALPGKRFLELAQQLDVIHHCTCANYAGVGRDAERKYFVGSSGEVLELALASAGRLKRLVHWSSALLFAPSNGRVAETESNGLDAFQSRADEMRFRAEVLIRDAMKRVPITILRPAILVGDSKTGELDRQEAPYALLSLLASGPRDLRIPVRGSGDQFCNFVPIDYVLEAGLSIADNARSSGRTFHLIDERPISVQRMFELVAEAADRPAASTSLTRNLAALLLHAAAPGLERVGQVPRQFLDLLAREVVYDARNARELLAGSGIECPPLSSYLKTMVTRVRREQPHQPRPRPTRRDPHFEELEDPLDP
jgi:thioester reductase-like protein